MKISELLIAMAEDLESENNEALLLAEYDDDCLQKTATGLLRAAHILRSTAEELQEETEEVRPLVDVLKDVTKLAQELDDSGDEELQKRANVLDEILLTFGRPDNALSAFKQAQEQEIDKLRDQYRQQAVDKAWKEPKEALDKQNNREGVEKAVREQVKRYEPLEAPLNSRYCPDHPGAQIMRIADGVYQCSLDKKVYNYSGGYTTMKGNKVSGTDVAQQTMDFAFRSSPHAMFNTREELTGKFASKKSFPEFPSITRDDVLKERSKITKKASKQFPEFPNIKTAKIVATENGYMVKSEEGKNLGGPYDSKKKAEDRLQQVEYFKHKDENKAEDSFADPWYTHPRTYGEEHMEENDINLSSNVIDVFSRYCEGQGDPLYAVLRRAVANGSVKPSQDELDRLESVAEDIIDSDTADDEEREAAGEVLRMLSVKAPEELMLADDKLMPLDVKEEYSEAYDKVRDDTGHEPDDVDYFKDVNDNLCFEIMRDGQYREEYCWDGSSWSESPNAEGGAEEYFNTLKNKPEDELNEELSHQGLAPESEMRDFLHR